MATSKQIKLIFNMVRYWSRKSSTKGFTLPELLMAMVVAGIVVYAMLSLVISLLGTDRKETAKAQTQTEMTQAMDYIARDLEQAVYIYPGDCLGTSPQTTSSRPYSCADLSKQIDFTAAGVTPVLAFWKLEPLPYSTKDEDKLPENCSGFSGSQQQECFALLTGRHTYTLVVYSYQGVGNNHETWDGPIVINRFELRRYENTTSLKENEGYSDPGANFGSWTKDKDSALIPMVYNPVLVDSVDQNDANFKEACPDGYTESQNSISSFYSCVRNPSASGQDAIIYLRGNAAKRAGQPNNSRNPVYLPSIKRQVKARSVLNYTPLKLE
jgi:prepilin-type N-terminal cleavage/methylation domain-containing protein